MLKRLKMIKLLCPILKCPKKNRPGENDKTCMYYRLAKMFNIDARKVLFCAEESLQILMQVSLHYNAN